MTGYSRAICSYKVKLAVTRTHDTQDIDIYYSYYGAHVCVARKTLISKFCTLISYFSLNIAETLTKMVKDKVQLLKLENDKLKDKIQEIFGELQNLCEEVKAGRSGG